MARWTLYRVSCAETQEEEEPCPSPLVTWSAITSLWDNMSITRESFRELSVGQELVTSLGIFKVTSCIAMGRCCEVYQGEQCATQGTVALKVFRRHQEYGGALQRELYFLRKLSATNVVEHLGEVHWEGRDILVQELLTCTLRDIFLSIDDGSCSPWLVLTLASDLIRGLAHMHSNGIVHADLKPPNLLWDSKLSTFKIIDFGLSFKTTEKYLHAIQSRGYQAPESIKWNALNSRQKCDASERPGPAADIWSAGCIIFEAMTGSQFTSQWCEGDDIELTVKTKLAAMSFNFSDAFIMESQNFIIRCLGVSSYLRASASELLDDPWLMQYHQASFRDLSLLPTTVLRILNIKDPNPSTISSDTTEIVNEILKVCQTYGYVKDHQFESSLGNLYVCFRVPSEAESAQEALTKLVVNDRMLIVTFYPLNCWRQRDFY